MHRWNAHCHPRDWEKDLLPNISGAFIKFGSFLDGMLRLIPEGGRGVGCPKSFGSEKTKGACIEFGSFLDGIVIFIPPRTGKLMFAPNV